MLGDLFDSVVHWGDVFLFSTLRTLSKVHVTQYNYAQQLVKVGKFGGGKAK